jgi:serine/threonine protein kinase
MLLQTGARVGPYQILAPLGAGGMGEVYRARDTKLNRDVAIKVLPEHLARDPAALARFEREAQAVAALAHPNILAIHDFGSDGGLSYAVTELLDGDTLRGRLATTSDARGAPLGAAPRLADSRVGAPAGPLPARKAIEYAVQIARGIAAAHEKGIVHRDLKPENIFITRDGQVKVLDFGLAKTDGPAASAVPGDTQLATGTEPGTVMGTVGYMSPEQVRGLPVDRRTDIFSFGAVLYEMLTGQRAFRGDSHIETMNAILKEDPPELAEINPGMPTALERIVRRCLEKQPEERFHSAHDLGIALEAVSGSSSASAASLGVQALPRARRRLMPAIFALSVLAVGIAAYVAGRQSGTAGAKASPDYRRLTFRRGPIVSARLAPDGNTIVYSAAWDGPLHLYSTRPESPESQQLPFPNADVVSVSSSGELAIVMNRRTLRAYSRVGTLARAPLSGGASRAILEDVQDADWLRDGSSLAVARFTEGRYRLEFPIGTAVYETGGWISHPRVSPNGEMVAFLDHPIMGDDRGSAAVVDRTGKVRVLSGEYDSTQGLAWSPSGAEIWFTGAEKGSARALQAVTLSSVVRTVDRTPGNLTLGDIGRDGTVLLEHNNGRRGIVALPPGESKDRDLSWLDWSQPLDLSDDGKTLLISEQGDGGGAGYSVYLRKTDGSPAVRLGSGDAQALSPDGKWVVAQRLNPAPAQFVLLPTGAGNGKPVTNDSITHLQARFMPDGKRILFVGFAPGRQPRTYVQDLEGGTPKPVTPEGAAGTLVSPDGAVVVAGRQLYPIAGGDPRPITGLEPQDGIVRWTLDGRGLYLRRLLDSGVVQITQLDLATGRRTPVRQVAPLSESVGTGGIGQLLLTPDASAYVYGYGVTMSDLYLVKGLK